MKRSLVTLAAAGAATLALAPAASADVALSGGSTTLKLAPGTAKALSSLGVKVSPTGRARAAGGGIRFPITGGKIDPATAAGQINHRGGLRLAAGGTRVVLKDYRVTVGKKIRLSAKVGGSRVHILELRGKPRVTRSGFNTNVSGLRAVLTAKAARALNGAFGVKAFKKGLRLGSVSVKSKTSQTQLAASGGTALELDPGALQALTSQGIAPGVIAPATLSGTTATFPITGGRVGLDLASGQVRHSGGISLTKGSTVVQLTDFDIRLGAAPQLFARAQRRRFEGGDHRPRPVGRDAVRVGPRRHRPGRGREAHAGRGRRAQPGVRDHGVHRRARARARPPRASGR